MRGRWIGSYIRCYLRLVEDDRCNISENNPLSRHFATREEELFEIGAVTSECHATLLRQGVEGRLKDVVLVEVGSVVARVFTLHA
jgi:hypothetical protein